MIGSLLRLGVGLVYMALATAVFAVGCLLLLPWRNARIRLCNVFGHITGRVCLWLAGATLTPGVAEQARSHAPAIYISNHTSVVDIFLGIWLAPSGTCGVAKKEVVWYPFFGQLYLISGHLLLDRGNRASAVASLSKMAALMHRHGLGVWIWPEGTRARDGRLKPFKKGFAHLALASRRPIVPIVVAGAHRAWEKGSLRLRPTTLDIRVLDPIPTDDWTAEDLDARIEEVWRRFAAALPEDQRPLDPVHMHAAK